MTNKQESTNGLDYSYSSKSKFLAGQVSGLDHINHLVKQSEIGAGYDGHLTSLVTIDTACIHR